MPIVFTVRGESLLVDRTAAVDLKGKLMLLRSSLRLESSASESAGLFLGVDGGVAMENSCGGLGVDGGDAIENCCGGCIPAAAAVEEDDDDDDDDDVGIKDRRIAVWGRNPVRS